MVFGLVWTHLKRRITWKNFGILEKHPGKFGLNGGDAS
jgi:hypothetical protein